MGTSSISRAFDDPKIALTIAAASTFAALLLWQLRRQKYYASYNSAPSPPIKKPWVLGHIPDLLRPDYHLQVLQWANTYGPVFRLRFLDQLVLVVNDPAAVQRLFGRGPGSVVTRSQEYQVFDKVIFSWTSKGYSMFGTTDEEHWKHVRKATAPAFSTHNIRLYFPGVLESVKGLADDIKGQCASPGSSNSPAMIQLEPLLLRTTLVAALRALFEMEVPPPDKLQEVQTSLVHLLVESNKQIVDPLRSWMSQPWWPFPNKVRRELRHHQCIVAAFMREVTLSIRGRAKSDLGDTRLWPCLQRLTNARTGAPMSLEEQMLEVAAYVVAGFETSASTIGWCLYTAARYPDWQDKVVREVQAAGLTGDSLNPEVLGRLPLLNALISETMRLYPTAATSGSRVTTEESTHIAGYDIPRGIVVWSQQYSLHVMESLWRGEEPLSFKPDRWLVMPQGGGEPQLTYSAQYAHAPAGGGAASSATAGSSDASASGDTSVPRRVLPFGDGIKNCVGQAYGQMLVRTGLALLLLNFQFTLPPDLPSPEQGNLIVALTTKLQELRLLVSRRT